MGEFTAGGSNEDCSSTLPLDRLAGKRRRARHRSAQQCAGTDWAARSARLSGAGLAEATGLIGDGSTTSFTINHNFNTSDVAVEVFEVATGLTIFPTVRRTDEDNVVISFKAEWTPTLNQYRYIIRASIET